MQVHVTMNNTRLAALSRAQVNAAVKTAMQMLNETRNEQIMPFDTGHMQNESTYVDDSNARHGDVKIITDTPYVRRLYFHPEINFHKDKNANAQAEWWEPWLSGTKKNRPKQLFREFYRREAGLL